MSVTNVLVAWSNLGRPRMSRFRRKAEMASDSWTWFPPAELTEAAVVDASVGRPLASRRELNELLPGRGRALTRSGPPFSEGEAGLLGDWGDGDLDGKGGGESVDGRALAMAVGDGAVVWTRGRLWASIAAAEWALTSSCEVRRECAGLRLGLPPGLVRLRRGGRTSCPPRLDETDSGEKVADGKRANRLRGELTPDDAPEPVGDVEEWVSWLDKGTVDVSLAGGEGEGDRLNPGADTDSWPLLSGVGGWTTTLDEGTVASPSADRRQLPDVCWD